MSDLTACSSVVSLVPGDPDAVRRLALRLDALAGGLGEAAAALAAIKSGTWRGAAGDAFRSILGDQPVKFRRGAESFCAGRVAVLLYATALERAQASAKDAIEEFVISADLSRRWQVRVEEYLAMRQRATAGDAATAVQVAAMTDPRCADPGLEGRLRAQRRLADARDQVRVAATDAARALEEAARAAPNRPGILRRIAHAGSEFVRGFAESVYGLANFVMTYSPGRLLFDQAGWTHDVGALGRGFVYGAQHPLDFGKALVDWETWQTSPARAVGHLAPNVLLWLAAGGVSTVAERAGSLAATAERVAPIAGAVAARAELVAAATERVAPIAGRISSATAPATRWDAAQRMHQQDEFDHANRRDDPTSGRGPDAAAARAAAWQTGSGGLATDRWANTRLWPGDLIAVSSSPAEPETFHPIAVPIVDVYRLDRLTGATMRAKLQLAAGPSLVDSGWITVVRVNSSLEVAAARAIANPQNGQGGAVQLFLPDLHELIRRGILTVVEQRQLEAASAPH